MPKKREEKRPVILSLHQLGTPDHQRFCISDQYLRYWAGSKGWTEQHDQANATLFASAQEALVMMNTIMLIKFAHLPKRTYVAPLILDLYAPAEVSIRDLQMWLLRISKVLMDTPRHGNGPLEGSYGSVRVNYGELKEVPQ
jgi:hypothetical protein